MHKSVDNELCVKYLSLIGSCYATGDFEPLFPYLSSDCVWESQWRLTPEVGKYTVEKYFRKKGSILKQTGSFPKWMIVELVDNMNPMRHTNIVVNGEEKQNVSFAMWYRAGELALFMDQLLASDEHALSLMRIQLDSSDLIQRMDMCMPELFKFVKYDIHEKI